MGFFGKIWSYISFQKQQEHTDKGSNFNLRAMHTINKISLFMFLMAVVVLFFRWVVF